MLRGGTLAYDGDRAALDSLRDKLVAVGFLALDGKKKSPLSGALRVIRQRGNFEVLWRAEFRARCSAQKAAQLHSSLAL